MSDNINELAAALAKAQGEMTSAKMDKTNPHFKSKYASLNSLQEATRPILAKHNLSICQVPVQADNGIILETHLMHASGQQLVSDWLVPFDGNIQKIGSTMTYVKRYAWSAMCGIAGDEDDDGNGATQTTETRATYSAPKPANGNGKPGKVNNPAALLEYVNAKLEPEQRYQSVPHLFNALKLVNSDEWQWPAADDKDGWKTAYTAAVARQQEAAAE